MLPQPLCPPRRFTNRCVCQTLSTNCSDPQESLEQPYLTPSMLHTTATTSSSSSSFVGKPALVLLYVRACFRQNKMPASALGSAMAKNRGTLTNNSLFGL